jgi:hypothetical protein
MPPLVLNELGEEEEDSEEELRKLKACPRSIRNMEI